MTVVIISSLSILLSGFAIGLSTATILFARRTR